MLQKAIINEKKRWRGKKSQQRNRKCKEEPNENFRTENIITEI